MILSAFSATHPGLVRTNNEDSVLVRLPEDGQAGAARGALLAVADGVGGQAAGEVASRAAIDALVAEYYSPRAPHQIESALRQAAQAANLRVYNLAHGPDAQLHGMQTTLSAVALSGQHAYVAHAGDTRVYLLRGGRLTLLTADHSEAAELLRLRLITAEQARDHPRRSVLTRALGGNLLMRPDFSRHALLPGDRLLICTDGLWGEVPHEEIARLASLAPEYVAGAMVDAACTAGGGDNVTVAIAHVHELGVAPPAPNGRIARLLAGLRGG